MKFGAERFVVVHFEKGLGGFQRDFADGSIVSGIENPVNFWRGHWTSIWQIQSRLVGSDVNNENSQIDDPSRRRATAVLGTPRASAALLESRQKTQ